MAFKGQRLQVRLKRDLSYLQKPTLHSGEYWAIVTHTEAITDTPTLYTIVHKDREYGIAPADIEELVHA